MTDAKKIWEAWGQASTLYNAWAAERSINPYQLFVLYAIDGHDAITQRMIADYTGLSKQTVNTVVRTLKADGYIELASASADRREKLVRFTPAGAEYSARLLAPLYALEKDVVDMIGADRIGDMLSSIRLFTTVFEKEMESHKHEQDKH